MTSDPRQYDVFVHDEGTWNVSSIRELAASRPASFPVVTLDIDPGLIRYIEENIRPDPERMAAIPEELLREPALAVTLHSGRVLLIDNHHRILRLRREGATEFSCIILDQAQTRLHRLR